MFQTSFVSNRLLDNIFMINFSVNFTYTWHQNITLQSTLASTGFITLKPYFAHSFLKRIERFWEIFKVVRQILHIVPLNSLTKLFHLFPTLLIHVCLKQLLKIIHKITRYLSLNFLITKLTCITIFISNKPPCHIFIIIFRINFHLYFTVTYNMM